MTQFLDMTEPYFCSSLHIGGNVNLGYLVFLIAFLSSAGMGWWLSTSKFSQFWEKKLFWGSNRLVSHDHPQAIVFLGVSRQRSVVQNIADRSAIVAKKPSIIAIAIILWVNSWYSFIKNLRKKTLKTLSLSRIGRNHFHSSPTRGN